METEPGRRAGRPRDAGVADAILDAAIALIAEQGVDETSTAEIAARAHTGKDTIYRRWAHKEDLVRAALDRLLAGHGLPDPRGSLEGDLEAWLDALARALEETALGPILLASAARAPHETEARAWLERYRRRLDAEVGSLLQRHGREADARARAAASLLADACLGRWLQGAAPDPDDPARAMGLALLQDPR